jgi:hypothetical protein
LEGVVLPSSLKTLGLREAVLSCRWLGPRVHVARTRLQKADSATCCDDLIARIWVIN